MSAAPLHRMARISESAAMDSFVRSCPLAWQAMPLHQPPGAKFKRRFRCAAGAFPNLEADWAQPAVAENVNSVV
jgi:hypothetical protein